MPDRKIGRNRSKRDVVSLLEDQLQIVLGPGYHILWKKEKPWASITFSGVRHIFQIVENAKLRTSNLSSKLENLPDHEFDLPGQFVADVLIRERNHQNSAVDVEILTIADPVSEE